MVVDFSIEDRPDPVVRSAHGLQAGIGCIENGQPGMGESNSPARRQMEFSGDGPVWTTMAQGAQHSLEGPPNVNFRARRQEAGKTAHRISALFGNQCPVEVLEGRSISICVWKRSTYEENVKCF